MIDWNALLQTIIAAITLAGSFSYVFKRYTEKRIDFVFDQKMKEYEAKLREITTLRIGLGQDRIREYKKLSGLVNSVRKNTVLLYEKEDKPEAEIAQLMAEAKELQRLIYDLSITLHMDNIYELVHGYKIEVVSLIKNFENERKLIQLGQVERAKGVREVSDRSLAEVKQECKEIVDLLVGLVKPGST